MAPIPGSWLTNPLFQVISFAAGTAIGPVLRPELQELENITWAAYAVRPLSPGEAAQVVARQIPSGLDLAEQARYSGFDKGQFDAMTELARQYPDLDTLLTLWRRDKANQSHIPGALNRHGFSDDWTARLLTLVDERLSPQEVALGIVRSIIKDPNLLAVTLDTSGGAVEAYTQSTIDALTEAYDAGIDKERLRVMVGEIGLPMSAQQAASALFRKIVLPNGKTFARGDYNRAILEGDTRPEWADAILEQAREILTANQYAELQLRGYIDAPTRRKFTAQHGMSVDDSDRLYDVLGRSVPVHQITTGLARGGAYPGSYANVPQPYKASIQRGNLREEYAELAYANRYTYPSFFAIRALMQANVLSADEGYQKLLEMGWQPELARKVADFYGVTVGPVSDPHVTKAETQLWGTTHRSYIASESNDADAEARFALLKIPGAAQPEILALWQSERELIRKQLTPAQIKKAYAKMSRNYATGQPWTRDDALAALVARGYSVTEANDFLDIPSGP